MLRFWGQRDREKSLLRSPGWEPHAVGPSQYGVYASRWPAYQNATAEAGGAKAAMDGMSEAAMDGMSGPQWYGVEQLWTLVNRAGTNVTGTQFTTTVPADDSKYPKYFYDCYNGVELTPTVALHAEWPAAPPAAAGSVSSTTAISMTTADTKTVHIAFDIEQGGYGCLAQTNGPADEALLAHLQTMKRITQRALARYMVGTLYTLVPFRVSCTLTYTAVLTYTAAFVFCNL
jgi:hypothetical protein